MKKEQMELGLENPLAFRRVIRRQRRMTRARWWFAQMRQSVNQAVEATPTDAMQPKQACLAFGAKATERDVADRIDLN